MPATIAPLKTSIPVQSPDHRIELTERFAIRVPGRAERTVEGRAINIVGRRLIAQIAGEIAAGEPVRIDGPDALLLGEVLGCWREGGLVFAAVELQQALTHLSDLARWMEQPDPWDVRLSA